ncbi:hypothetical protein J4Q44_G00139610 [Coregonus suidteri]|uniref:Uncharacterized protein n=1 Tax=Coregonus suidteri TaxID=861788 RepID=A0AAN8M0K9_9TELE
MGRCTLYILNIRIRKVLDIQEGIKSTNYSSISSYSSVEFIDNVDRGMGNVKLELYNVEFRVYRIEDVETRLPHSIRYAPSDQRKAWGSSE